MVAKSYAFAGANSSVASGYAFAMCRANLFAGQPNVFAGRPSVFASRPNVFARPPNVFASRPNVFARRPKVFVARPNEFARRRTCSWPDRTCSRAWPNAFVAGPIVFASRRTCSRPDRTCSRVGRMCSRAAERVGASAPGEQHGLAQRSTCQRKVRASRPRRASLSRRRNSASVHPPVLPADRPSPRRACRGDETPRRGRGSAPGWRPSPAARAGSRIGVRSKV